jgi:hypothetical protein
MATATKEFRDAGRLARRAGDGREAEFATRCDGVSHELDAERGLDQGGGFSTEAVGTWPAQR